MKIYFAGPLFTEAERDWIRGTKRRIEEVAKARGADVTVVWPYELVTKEELETLGDRAKYEVYRQCKSHLENADLLIAVLDGTQVDDGTAWEIGYFYGLRRDRSRIIGVRTDFRNAGEAKNSVVNAMVECSCSGIARSAAELLAVITEKMPCKP